MFDEVAFLVSVGVGVSVLFLVWGWRVRGCGVVFFTPPRQPKHQRIIPGTSTFSRGAN